MYEELRADLRETAEYIGPNNYELPIMLYDNLFKAADAIEELSQTVEEQKAQIITMAAEGKQRWISVNERLPKEFVSVQAHMTDAGPFPSIREAYLICDNKWFFPALREVRPVDYWMPLGSNIPLPEPQQEEQDG